MLKDDFYADPTVFDHWHSHTSSWLGVWIEKLRPYFWSMGFSALAASCALIVLGISAYLLTSNWNAAAVSDWNSLSAQLLTLLLASIATYQLLKQVVSAWPENQMLPRPVWWLAAWLDGCPEVATTPELGVVPNRADDTQAQIDTRAQREFFIGVRKAGINLNIAKALFTAGVRSTQQVCLAKNRDLLKIHGVGPATVRKLRSQFGTS